MCSLRAAVFFLASNHVFFSITQMAYILPVTMGGKGDTLETIMAFLFAILFFTTGFMTFRAADEESATLIRIGGICLFIVIIFRFILLALTLMLVETIPEASFLYIYEIPELPIIFTSLLYIIYLIMLYFYYKKLKAESAARRAAASANGGGGNGNLNISSSSSSFPATRHYHYPRRSQYSCRSLSSNNLAGTGTMAGYSSTIQTP